MTEVLDKSKEMKERFGARAHRMALVETILAAGCGDNSDAHFWLDVAFTIRRNDRSGDKIITGQAYDKARDLNKRKFKVDYWFTMSDLYKACSGGQEASAYFWMDVLMEIRPEDKYEFGIGVKRVDDGAKELLEYTASLPAVFIALCRALWCFDYGAMKEAHVWIDVFILLGPAGTKDVVRA